MINIAKRIYSYDELNKIYDKYYEPRLFTSFELKLFNNEFETIDLKQHSQNIENVYSLANYFDIINDTCNSLKCIHILLEHNDVRGFNKLGVHLLQHDKNEDAKKVFSVGSSRGYVICTANLGCIYYKEKNYDVALQYFLKALQNGKTNIFCNIALVYMMKDDIAKCCKYATQGVIAEEQKCMDILETFLPRDELYMFLLKLKTTNNLIQNKIRDLHRTIDVNQVNIDSVKETFFKTPSGEILNYDFDQVLDLKEYEDIQIENVHTMSDITYIIFNEIVKTCQQNKK